MLDRHAVQELHRAKVKAREIAKQFGVSLSTVRRIAREATIESADRTTTRMVHPVGRPAVTAQMRDRVKALLVEDPERPPGEIARLLRDEGTALGLSTVYRLLTAVRPTLPVPLMVRFEGVAGEFAQFDFGEAMVRLMDGKQRTVHFAAYRLKYSRWMHVALVPNERIEALVRALLDSFAAAGAGVPLRVVFDNPKTVVLRREEGRPVWNATLAQVAIDYGFTVELCAPRSPEQKGLASHCTSWAA
jgi:transposase